MAKLRKQWSTTSIPGAARRIHASRAAAYRHTRELAAQFAAGALRQDLRHVNVWVDERDGRGWQHFERLSLADLAGVAADTPKEK